MEHRQPIRTHQIYRTTEQGDSPLTLKQNQPMSDKSVISVDQWVDTSPIPDTPCGTRPQVRSDILKLYQLSVKM